MTNRKRRSTRRQRQRRWDKLNAVLQGTFYTLASVTVILMLGLGRYAMTV